MDLDAYEQAGLYDPASPEAAKRRALLDWLEAQGTSIEQMQRSASYGALSSAAGDALIRPGAPITLAALAERVGLPEERILEILRAAGASSATGESQTFVESDAETFALFKAAAGLFSPDAVLEITRVMGNAMARVAEAAITLFQVNVEAPLAESDAAQITFAEANLAGVRSLDLLPRALERTLPAPRGNRDSAIAPRLQPRESVRISTVGGGLHRPRRVHTARAATRRS